MSDLISRSALLEAMDKRYNEKQGIVPDNLAEGFMQMEKLIKEQPIAYDKESVIDWLESERYMLVGKQIIETDTITINRAIERVKAGGIDG